MWFCCGTEPLLSSPCPALCRVPWAEACVKYFSQGKNKTALDCIDRAAFFLTLDDEAHAYEQERPESLDQYAKSLLHGNCYDR